MKRKRSIKLQDDLFTVRNTNPFGIIYEQGPPPKKGTNVAPPGSPLENLLGKQDSQEMGLGETPQGQLPLEGPASPQAVTSKPAQPAAGL